MAKHCITAIVILSLLSLQCCLSSAKSESILIIALPQSDTEVSASWERGEEILLGALAATEEAKNDSLSFNLSLVVATSGPITRYDLPYSGNVLDIIANLTWQERTSDIIGIAGVLHPNVLAVISRFQLPIASLIHFDNTPGLDISSSVQYMTASTSILTDSILTFMKEIHPRKIKIITEIKHPYWKVSNQLSTRANISLDIEIIHEHQTFNLLSNIADKIYESNTHVVLLSVGPSTAVSMLCEACKRGLTWPHYAWILHSYRFEDLLNDSLFNEECTAQKILEGLFIFQLTEEQNDLDSVITQGNPYADLLYDSVRALISSIDNRLSAHLIDSSLSPHFSPDSSKIYIYQNLNGTVSLTGTYDGTSYTLTKLNETFIDYDLPQIHIPTLSLYILPLPILSFLFNTVLLVLYIVFRNAESIKSTSVSLSILMFAGCYLLAIFAIFDILFDVYRINLCMLLFSLSTLGLPIPLIYVILLLKMLRVYRIFTKFKVFGKSRKYKDYALLFYMALLVLPHAALLIIRTLIDPSRRFDSHIEYPGFIEIVSVCTSEHWYVWYFVPIPYYFILQGSILIVAIKTRKIQSKNFKDTKKVNLFIFLFLMIGLCGVAYLYTFFTVGLYYYSAILTIVIHTLIPSICQFTLFVPKIWPPLRKKVIIIKTKT